MFGQILVPLDGSDRAERALPVAARLAAATGATVHLVRTVEIPALTTSSLYVPVNIHDDLMASEHRDAATYLDRVRAGMDDGEGVRPIRTAHPTGDAASMLLDYERDMGIDLVVMCSHGRSGLVRFALGSIAERLLRHGIAPTLLVAATGMPVALEHVLVPLDGSTMAEEALQVVEGLVAGSVVREVALLRAVDAAAAVPEAERYLQEVGERLMGQHLACSWQVTHGDAAEAVVDAAGAGTLVVMTAHGRGHQTHSRSRWMHGGFGSVADRVTRGGAAGVLIVRPGRGQTR